MARSGERREPRLRCGGAVANEDGIVRPRHRSLPRETRRHLLNECLVKAITFKVEDELAFANDQLYLPALVAKYPRLYDARDRSDRASRGEGHDHLGGAPPRA